MKAFQRILAVLLCLVISLGMISMVASAESIFDSDRDTGSLTIYKYQKGDGDVSDSTGLTETVTGHTLLSDVTFKIYRVMDKTQFTTYLGMSNAAEALDPLDYYDYNSKTNKYTAKNNVTYVAQDVTEADGKAEFTNLDLGVYLVIETDYPAEVTSPMVPFLVSIPMTDPIDQDTWIYDVVVHPKNSTSVGTVKLVKKGEGASEYLKATFSLEKKDVNGAWQAYETATVTTPDSSAGVEIENLEHGEYKLTETSVDATGYVVNASPIYFTVNNNNTVTYNSDITTHEKVTDTGSGTSVLTLTVENEKPEVTKKVTTGTNATPGVGENVEYTVTVEVPTNVEALSSFTVVDNPENLAVNDGSVAVVDESDNAIAANLYSVNYEGNGFVLTFVHANMATYGGQTLTITYNAEVQESAAENGKTKNTVTLTYNDGVRAVTDTAETEQKYCTIDITKWKDAANTTYGEVAGNVKFKLYKDSELKQEVKVTGTTGAYVYDADAATDADATLTTDANGKLVVSGLPAGTYYLKETKAPDGYNLLKDAIEITVDTDDTTDDPQVKTLPIINKAGFELPETGGIGTLMFIIIGGVLMAGGICLIVPNKKRAV